MLMTEHGSEFYLSEFYLTVFTVFLFVNDMT